MQKTRKYLLLLLLALTVGSVQPIHAQGMNNIDVEQLRKLQMAQVAIASLYVDSVDQKKLAEYAIRGMLDKLDPHSSYSDPVLTRKMYEPI